MELIMFIDVFVIIVSKLYAVFFLIRFKYIQILIFTCAG